MSNPTQNTLTAVTGGVEMSVTFADGTTGIVRVRELPIRLLPKYNAVQDNEADTIELFCDMPKGWVDKLTRESAEQLLTAGEGLNLSFLRRHVERQQARQEKLMPGMAEKLMREAMKDFVDKATEKLSPSESPSPNLPPKSA